MCKSHLFTQPISLFHSLTLSLIPSLHLSLRPVSQPVVQSSCALYSALKHALHQTTPTSPQRDGEWVRLLMVWSQTVSTLCHTQSSEQLAETISWEHFVPLLRYNVQTYQLYLKYNTRKCIVAHIHMHLCVCTGPANSLSLSLSLSPFLYSQISSHLSSTAVCC